MHPGNIGLLRNSRIALIDFGSTSFTEAEYLQRFRMLMRTLATGEFAKSADMCLMLCASLPPMDLALVHHKVVSVIQAWANAYVGAAARLPRQVDGHAHHEHHAGTARLPLHDGVGVAPPASCQFDARCVDHRAGAGHRLSEDHRRRLRPGRAPPRWKGSSAGWACAARPWPRSRRCEQPARLQEYVALQASLIRRQVQVFRGFAGLAGSTLVSAVNAGRLVLVLQVGVVLAAAVAASASGVAGAGHRVTEWLGNLAADAIASDPRPLAGHPRDRRRGSGLRCRACAGPSATAPCSCIGKRPYDDVTRSACRRRGCAAGAARARTAAGRRRPARS